MTLFQQQLRNESRAGHCRKIETKRIMSMAEQLRQTTSQTPMLFPQTRPLFTDGGAEPWHGAAEAAVADGC